MLDPLRILGSVAASSGVGRAGHQRGVTWRPRPSQEPKAGQGDGDTKAGAAMGRDSDQKLCVCVSTHKHTIVHTHVCACPCFYPFRSLGCFLFVFLLPSLQLISLPSFLLFLASMVLSPSFLSLSSLHLCLHLCLLFPCFSICHPTLHPPISLSLLVQLTPLPGPPSLPLFPCLCVCRTLAQT